MGGYRKVQEGRCAQDGVDSVGGRELEVGGMVGSACGEGSGREQPAVLFQETVQDGGGSADGDGVLARCADVQVPVRCDSLRACKQDRHVTRECENATLEANLPTSGGMRRGRRGLRAGLWGLLLLLLLLGRQSASPRVVLMAAPASGYGARRGAPDGVRWRPGPAPLGEAPQPRWRLQQPQLQACPC